MKENTLKITLRSTFVAVFAALICSGCFISIPLPGGVPITVQNMFAIISGTILGSYFGAISVAVFLVLGVIGIPVFSGMKSGFAHLLGATGGFLWGYLLAALVAGLILGSPKLEEKKFNWIMILKIALAYFAGLVCNYVPGILWFIHVKGGLSEKMTLLQVLNWTTLPFLPGDFIKMAVSIPLTAVLRPIAARYLYSAKTDKNAEAAAVEQLKEKSDTNE